MINKKNNKNSGLVPVFYNSNADSVLIPFNMCIEKVEKLFHSTNTKFMFLFDSKNGIVDRVILVGKKDKDRKYIETLFNRKASYTKYNDKIGSCLFHLYDLPVASLEDLLNSGLKAVRVFENGKFTELKERDVRNKSIFVFEPRFGMDKGIIETSAGDTLSRIKDKAIPIANVIKDEAVYKFIKSSDITKISKALYTYWDVLSGCFEAQMEHLWSYLVTIFVLRADGKLRVCYPNKGETADFKGEDYDSSNSCETGLMVVYEGGIKECLSYICDTARLDKKVMMKVIEKMLDNPTSKLNKLFADTVIKNTCGCRSLADRFTIINGPTVEFVKRDEI